MINVFWENNFLHRYNYIVLNQSHKTFNQWEDKDQDSKDLIWTIYYDKVLSISFKLKI